MNWLDIAGPPGAGKSTLCNPICHEHSITWDGKLPPAYWRPFLDEMTALFGLIRGHWSFTPAVRMNNRSVRKMATVERMWAFGMAAVPGRDRKVGLTEELSDEWIEAIKNATMSPEHDHLNALMDDDGKQDLNGGVEQRDARRVPRPETEVRSLSPQPLSASGPGLRASAYIQTGLVQRGLGFGWRLNQMGADVNLIRPFFWRMPVSIGVVFLEADDETVIARNKARRQVAATAHEDRSFMVPLMREPIRIAKEVLRERGIPVLELDVQHQPIETARERLLAFAGQGACHAATLRSGHQGEVLSPPPWWQRS